MSPDPTADVGRKDRARIVLADTRGPSATAEHIRSGDITNRVVNIGTALAAMLIFADEEAALSRAAPSSELKAGQEWPDIGPDPMKGDRRDRIEQSIAACRAAYVKQQGGVPDQTALVWRWHLGALIEYATRLKAMQDRAAPSSGHAMAEEEREDFNGHIPNRYIPDMPDGAKLFGVCLKTGQFYYINHAGTWQGMPSPLSPSGETGIAEAVERMRADPFIDDAHLLGTTSQDQRMQHYAALALATTPPTTNDAIPAGMVRWDGGDRAPDDWDGGPVFIRSGGTINPGNGLNSLVWSHPHMNVGDKATLGGDIIAYTPKPSPTPKGGLPGRGEVEP